MNIKTIIVAGALALGLVGCTDSQWNVVHGAIDGAGAVCQVVVAATDPKLAPLCTTATAIADAVAALVRIKTHSAADPNAPDGAYTPSNDEVYTYLANHGARTAKKP